MTRRTALKWLHWLAAGLILYFFLVEPEDDEDILDSLFLRAEYTPAPSIKLPTVSLTIPEMGTDSVGRAWIDPARPTITTRTAAR